MKALLFAVLALLGGFAPTRVDAHGDHESHSGPYQNARIVETSQDAAIAATAWWKHVQSTRIADASMSYFDTGDLTPQTDDRFFACREHAQFNMWDSREWPTPDLYCRALTLGDQMWSMWPYGGHIPRGLGGEAIREDAVGMRARYEGGASGTLARLTAEAYVLYDSLPNGQQIPLFSPADWVELLSGGGDCVAMDVVFVESGWEGDCRLVDGSTAEVIVGPGAIELQLDVYADVEVAR